MIKTNYFIQLLAILSLFYTSCSVPLSVGIQDRLEFVNSKKIGKKESSIILAANVKEHSEPNYSNKIIINVQKKYETKLKEIYNLYKEHKIYVPHPSVKAEFLVIPYIINNFIDLGIAFGTIFDESHYIKNGFLGAVLACILPSVSLGEVPEKFLKKDYVGKTSRIRKDIEYTTIGGSVLVSNEIGKEISFQINNYGNLILDISDLIEQDLLNDENKVLTFSFLGQKSRLTIEQSMIDANRKILEVAKKSKEKKIYDLYLQLENSTFEKQILLKELIHLLEQENGFSSSPE